MKIIKAIRSPKKVLKILKKRYFGLNVDATLSFLEEEVGKRKITEGKKSPKVSIIIVTYNNLKYTKACLYSILLYSDQSSYEIILIDNGSKDETQNFLKEFQKRYDNIKIVLNSGNKGFAGGCNQGIKKAAGDYLIFLNNDTIVTPGWIKNIIKSLDSDVVGLVGPVTNFMWNHQEIDIHYTTLKSLLRKSEKYMEENKGGVDETDGVAFFCVAARRDFIEKIGDLDERFGVGMFEDDDYCLRVRKSKHKILINRGVFVHHFGQISLFSLGNTEYNRIFEENRGKFEKKWGIKWKPNNK